MSALNPTHKVHLTLHARYSLIQNAAKAHDGARSGQGIHIFRRVLELGRALGVDKVDCTFQSATGPEQNLMG